MDPARLAESLLRDKKPDSTFFTKIRYNFEEIMNMAFEIQISNRIAIYFCRHKQMSEHFAYVHQA